MDELIEIFKENENNKIICKNIPIEIIYCISQLVGNAIIWLRKPGLNIFKWSVNSTINITNIKKWKFKYNIENEFYFSGYIGNETMNELLLLNNNNNKYKQYLDLDWCFVAFLLLGLIPKNENKYFKWYFNQKLLSALPSTYPFKLLLKR